MLHENDFGTWERYQELQLDQMTAEQRRTYHYTNERRGQVPSPYEIWRQNTKFTELMVPLGVYYQRHSVLSRTEIEIATTLIDGKSLAHVLRQARRPSLRTQSVLPHLSARDLRSCQSVRPMQPWKSLQLGCKAACRSDNDKNLIDTRRPELRKPFQGARIRVDMTSDHLAGDWRSLRNMQIPAQRGPVTETFGQENRHGCHE
jgi:hypothetical protein